MNRHRQPFPVSQLLWPQLELRHHTTIERGGLTAARRRTRHSTIAVHQLV